MLFGSYEHSLDSKNRCRLPARLKAELGNEPPVIVKGQDKCLYIYPASTINKISENLTNGKAQEHQLKSLRIFLSSMYPIDEDNQGRFTLNSVLKNYSGIDKEVVFNGVNNRIELWSKESWVAYQDVDNDSISEMLNALSEYGL